VFLFFLFVLKLFIWSIASGAHKNQIVNEMDCASKINSLQLFFEKNLTPLKFIV